jgi:hypothetical protein
MASGFASGTSLLRVESSAFHVLSQTRPLTYAPNGAPVAVLYTAHSYIKRPGNARRPAVSRAFRTNMAMPLCTPRT